MFSGSPPALVVGRTLSSYFAGDVQNNRETITFTVYNQQATPISGVLLTDTLLSGVTFLDASIAPNQDGQKLAWSLGTIGGFGRASVTLNVQLADSGILALDSSVQAFGILDAAAVTDSAPAAMLRAGSAPAAATLASTPDANTTDPYIQEQAAKLDYDAQKIFNFLHSEIDCNSYYGSMRGSRGTLWSAAGNSLDVASLGVALMRASGIPSNYAFGTLSTGQAQQLILSMFPQNSQVLGYINPGVATADPANDPTLLAETKPHYWFQFDAGAGVTNADPLMAGASVGQTFTGITNTFSEVNDALRAKTEIKVTAGITNTATSLFGLPSENLTTVLDQTFNDVDLVGRSVTVGQFVNQSSIGGLFSTTTNNYSPYLAITDDAEPDARRGQLISGTNFQEFLTTFPFGSQILTGLFLDVTMTQPKPDGSVHSETINKTLFDRIGFAARQNGSGGSISVSPDGSCHWIIFRFSRRWVFQQRLTLGLAPRCLPGIR